MEKTIMPYTLIEAFRKLDNIYECRLLGWILAKAQSVLKLYNKDLGDINIEHAMNLVTLRIPTKRLLNYSDTNYTAAKKAFSLARKTIPYSREGLEMELNIIAFPQIVRENNKSYVTCVIHNELWHAMLNFSKGYRLVDLATYMKLQSKYAIVLYLLTTQQNKTQAFSLTTLRRYTGTDTNKAYGRTANFRARVLDSARAELDKQSPYSFDYEIARGTKNKEPTILITPRRREAPPATEHDKETAREAAEQRLRLDTRVVEYLRDKYSMNTKEMSVAEPLLERLGEWGRQIDFLAGIAHITAARRIENPKAYLVASLKQAI